jgi:RNA polymerase sigma-70 factor (ECF subfamily)
MEGTGEAAFAELIAEHFDAIYRYAYRYAREAAAAEDIVQETFIKAWKSSGTFKKDMPVLPWLFRIAHNTAIDYLRKKKPLMFSHLNDGDGIEETLVDVSTDIMETSIAREEKETLTNAIEHLPAHYREVLLLRAEEMLSFEEISTVVGKPLNTVKSLYRRGLALLHKTLSKSLL